MKNTIVRYLAILRLYFSAIPLIWSIMFYLFLFRAILKIGKIPQYNMPDPKDLNFNLHYSLLFYGIPVCLLAIILYPILIAFTFRKKSPIMKELSIYFLGVIIFIIQVYIDPLGVQEWFTD